MRPKFTHFLQHPARKKVFLLGGLFIALGSSLSWNPENTQIVRHVTPAYEETMLALTTPDVAAEHRTLTEPITLPAAAPRVEVRRLTDAERDELERLRRAQSSLKLEDIERIIAKKLEEQRVIRPQDRDQVSVRRDSKGKIKVSYPRIENDCDKDLSSSGSRRRTSLLEGLSQNGSGIAAIQGKAVSASYVSCLTDTIESELENCEEFEGDDEADIDRDDKEARKEARVLKAKRRACERQVNRFYQRHLRPEMEKAAISNPSLATNVMAQLFGILPNSQEYANLPKDLLAMMRNGVMTRANAAASTTTDPQQAQFLYRQSIMNEIGNCGFNWQAGNYLNCQMERLFLNDRKTVSNDFTNPIMQEAQRGYRPNGGVPVPIGSTDPRRRQDGLPRFTGFPGSSIAPGTRGPLVNGQVNPGAPGAVVPGGAVPAKPVVGAAPATNRLESPAPNSGRVVPRTAIKQKL